MPDSAAVPFGGANRLGGIAGEVLRLRAALEQIKAETPDLVTKALADAALNRVGTEIRQPPTKAR